MTWCEVTPSHMSWAARSTFSSTMRGKCTGTPSCQPSNLSVSKSSQKIRLVRVYAAISARKPIFMRAPKNIWTQCRYCRQLCLLSLLSIVALEEATPSIACRRQGLCKANFCTMSRTAFVHDSFWIFMTNKLENARWQNPSIELNDLFQSLSKYLNDNENGIHHGCHECQIIMPNINWRNQVRSHVYVPFSRQWPS